MNTETVATVRRAVDAGNSGSDRIDLRVLADALEDSGYSDRANGLREVIRRCKFPAGGRYNVQYNWVRSSYSEHLLLRHVISQEVFDRLGQCGSFAFYETRSAAFLALAAAFQEISNA